ncbi:MAG: hypothetical protein ACYDEI_00665 [Erysipelotrichaceae bacterium]|jgi:predicted kinase
MSEVIVLTGAYGVGKSEFASQLALIKAPCVLADFDVINPYFRPREQTSWFESQGVKIIGSQIKNHINQDFPALSGDLPSYINQGKTVIIDCAGSENGLKPLASFMDALVHAKVYIVINFNRIESRLEYISELIDLFEKRSHLKIAGLVHNTHMLDETTVEMIISAQLRCEDLSKQLNLPIIYTMIRNDFYQECKEMIHNECVVYDKLILREVWMKGDTL